MNYIVMSPSSSLSMFELDQIGIRDPTNGDPTEIDRTIPWSTTYRSGTEPVLAASVPASH